MPQSFPSVIGIPEHSETMFINSKPYYIGDDATNRRGILTLRHPVQNGIVVDWDDMETLLHYTYNRLSADSSQHTVLLTEAPHNPGSNRETMTQLMFEKFNVPDMYISLSAILSVYASGRCSALVLVKTNS